MIPFFILLLSKTFTLGILKIVSTLPLSFLNALTTVFLGELIHKEGSSLMVYIGTKDTLPNMVPYRLPTSILFPKSIIPFM